MSTIIATTVLPDSTANDTLTFGATGDSVAISGDFLAVNTLQDAGGNTIFVSDGLGGITSTGLPGAMKFISSQTASGSASLSFTSGLDSTYDVYCFKFIDINPATDDANFTFQVNATDSTGYDRTMTTSFFWARNTEAGTGSVAYSTGMDQAQGTDFQILGGGIGNGADEVLSGELYLFAPASTTYVKHFFSEVQYYAQQDASYNGYMSGYINDTTAIDDIQFKMSMGNMDGIIALYGISKS